MANCCLLSKYLLQGTFDAQAILTLPFFFVLFNFHLHFGRQHAAQPNETEASQAVEKGLYEMQGAACSLR
jgi:hypothetical protein